MLLADALAVQPVPQQYQTMSGEQALDIIVQQEAAIRNIRERIIPAEQFPAAKGPGSIHSSVSAARLASAGRAGRAETTVIDFSTRSITNAAQRTGSPAVRFSYRPSGPYRLGQLGETVEQLQAAYAAERSRLERDFSGGGLDGEIEKLDEFYVQCRQTLAGSFSEMTGGFLEKYGQSGQTQKISGSVEALFRDGGKGEYSLAELDFAAAAMWAYRAAVNGICYGSEVWQAIRLSIADMKVERMAVYNKNTGTAGLMTGVLQEARPEIHRDFLDTMEAYFTKRREEGEESPPLEQDLFWTAYSAIMHEFRVSGNAMTAVHIVAEGAPELLTEALEQSPARRWSRELEPDGLWDSFDRPKYLCGMFATLEDDWQDFIDHFISRRELYGQG